MLSVVVATALLSALLTYSGFVRVDYGRVMDAIQPMLSREKPASVAFNPDENYTGRPCREVSYIEARDKCYHALAVEKANTSPRDAVVECESIGGFDRRLECLTTVEQITGNPLSGCEKNRNVVEKNTCLRDYAVDAAVSDATEAEMLCDLIENPLRMEWCYIEVADQIVHYNHTEAAKVCSRIFGENPKTECFTNIAEKLARTPQNEYAIEYCDRIPPEDKKNYCKAKAAYVTGISKAKEYCGKIKDAPEKEACLAYVGGGRG
jgi:hypothetical protein